MCVLPSGASGSSAVLQLLLDAGAPGLEAADGDGCLLLHLAAQQGPEEAVRLLLHAAPIAALVENSAGQIPLHLAAQRGHAEAVSLLLQAAPQTSLLENGGGRRPLHLALRQHHVGAARVLLLRSGLDTAQLLDALARACGDGHVHATLRARIARALQPLYVHLVSHCPLTTDQWQLVPAPCAAIATALPTVLARSDALLVAPSDAERLRVAALCLHRKQRCQHMSLPIVVIRTILALTLA